MEKLELKFVNFSEPALSAENMNKIIDKLNECVEEINKLKSNVETKE